jgi:hypothetical protein
MSNQEWISLQDAASQLGVERPAMYYYIRALKLEKKKFELDKNVYLKFSDFERIKKLREEAAKRKEPSMA